MGTLSTSGKFTTVTIKLGTLHGDGLIMWFGRGSRERKFLMSHSLINYTKEHLYCFHCSMQPHCVCTTGIDHFNGSTVNQ